VRSPLSRHCPHRPGSLCRLLCCALPLAPQPHRLSLSVCMCQVMPSRGVSQGRGYPSKGGRGDPSPQPEASSSLVNPPSQSPSGDLCQWAWGRVRQRSCSSLQGGHWGRGGGGRREGPAANVSLLCHYPAHCPIAPPPKDLLHRAVLAASPVQQPGANPQSPPPRFRIHIPPSISICFFSGGFPSDPQSKDADLKNDTTTGNKQIRFPRTKEKWDQKQQQSLSWLGTSVFLVKFYDAVLLGVIFFIYSRYGWDK